MLPHVSKPAKSHYWKVVKERPTFRVQPEERRNADWSHLFPFGVTLCKGQAGEPPMGGWLTVGYKQIYVNLHHLYTGGVMAGGKHFHGHEQQVVYSRSWPRAKTMARHSRCCDNFQLFHTHLCRPKVLFKTRLFEKNTEETHTVCIASHYMSVAQPTHPQSSATLQSKLISKVMVESAPKVASPAHLHEGRSIFVAAHENMLVSVKHIHHDTPGSSFQIIDSQICIIPYSGTMNIEVTFSQNIFFNSSMGLQPNMSR